MNPWAPHRAPPPPFLPVYKCPSLPYPIPSHPISRTHLYPIPLNPISFPFSLSPHLSQRHRTFSLISPELANPAEKRATLSPEEKAVLVLYEALNSRDADKVQTLLAPDLEWWFHGPPSHQFLMRLLTGTDDASFQFNPQSTVAFGSLVLAEGCDPTRTIFWVHAWTVSPNGLITHVREYFNTSLTVTRLGNRQQPSDQISPAHHHHHHHCQPIWESSLSNRVGKSVPGLVLAL